MIDQVGEDALANQPQLFPAGCGADDDDEVPSALRRLTAGLHGLDGVEGVALPESSDAAPLTNGWAADESARDGGASEGSKDESERVCWLALGLEGEKSLAPAGSSCVGMTGRTIGLALFDSGVIGIVGVDGSGWS